MSLKSAAEEHGEDFEFDTAVTVRVTDNYVIVYPKGVPCQALRVRLTTPLEAEPALEVEDWWGWGQG